MASVLDTTNYLATLAELKRYLRIDDTDLADDNRLEDAINAASLIANSLTNRSLRARAVTLYLDGPGNNVLSLPNWPVNATTSINESGDLPRVWDATTLVSSNDYIIDSERGLVYYEGSSWGSTRQSIRYIGNLGYGYSTTPVPGDLKQAVIQVSAKLFMFGRDGLDGKTSVSGGTGSVSVQEDALTPFAREVFDLYRRMGE